MEAQSQQRGHEFKIHLGHFFLFFANGNLKGGYYAKSSILSFTSCNVIFIKNM